MLDTPGVRLRPVCPDAAVACLPPPLTLLRAVACACCWSRRSWWSSSSDPDSWRMSDARSFTRLVVGDLWMLASAISFDALAEYFWIPGSVANFAMVVESSGKPLSRRISPAAYRLFAARLRRRTRAVRANEQQKHEPRIDAPWQHSQSVSVRCAPHEERPDCAARFLVVEREALAQQEDEERDRRDVAQACVDLVATERVERRLVSELTQLEQH